MAKRQLRARETLMLAVPKGDKNHLPADIIPEGALVDFDDPRVKGRENLFEETELETPAKKAAAKKTPAKAEVEAEPEA